MSGIKRISVGIPEELEREIIALRKTEEYCRCSYAEIMRKLITDGIKIRKTG